MAELTLQYPDELATAMGKTREQVEREMRFHFAARMYQLAEFSLGQAAKSAEMSKLKFVDELGKAKIPLINLDESETEAELRAIKQKSRFPI